MANIFSKSNEVNLSFQRNEVEKPEMAAYPSNPYTRQTELSGAISLRTA